MWILIILIGLIFGLLYYYIQKQNNFWDEQGVPWVKPKNVLEMFGFFKGKTLAEGTKNFYSSLDLRYFGIVVIKPMLLIKDPELIKTLAVKEFDSFMNHRTFIPEGVDPIWNKSLLGTTGQKWKQLRSVLSPSFTSSKMKTMFVLMQQCAEQYTDYFLNLNKDIVEVELKDIFARYTNDVVATTVFGVKCDSLKEPNNDFYLMAKKTSNLAGFFVFIKQILFIVFSSCPSLLKLLGLRLFSKESVNFYHKIIKETIKTREEKKIIRPDLINIFMEARKEKATQEPEEEIKEYAAVEEYNLPKKNKTEKLVLSDDDFVPQAMIFFLAGFDTSSTLMCFTGYELAINPECQEKLYREIVQTNEQCNGKVTYEALVKMKYLDMVVSETLRMWPAQAATDREANKDCLVDPVLPDEKPFLIKKGITILVPILGLHFDPQWYPNPEKFDPERFSDENKHTIHPFAYLPFGVGPRNCIGSRFALLETKLLLFNILLKFEIIPTAKSQIPIQLKTTSFTPNAKNGFHFGFKRRI